MTNSRSAAYLYTARGHADADASATGGTVEFSRDARCWLVYTSTGYLTKPLPRNQRPRMESDVGEPTMSERWVKLDGHRAWHRLIGPDDELKQQSIRPHDGRIGQRHGTQCGASGAIVALSTRVERRSRCLSCIADGRA